MLSIAAKIVDCALYAAMRIEIKGIMKLLCPEIDLDYGSIMRNTTINLLTISVGAVAGIFGVAAASGALVPVWSFFMDGLIQYFLSMQLGWFGCF